MKFGIDLGHGVGKDRGAVGIISEETIINDVGKLVIQKLRQLGHTVIELRPQTSITVSDSLLQRYKKANYYNVDLCVSIHANAGGGNGSEIFTYKGKEVLEAKLILDNLFLLGFRNRGIKDGSHLAMVRGPKSTAFLIEICFVDSSDVDLYNKIGADLIADKIVQGLTNQNVDITAKWMRDDTGWWYEHADKSYTKGGWEKIDGKWYLFDLRGYMLFGWQYLGGYNWYYLGDEDDGAMKIGWVFIDNKWYYFDLNGIMQVGWVKIEDDWYYFNNNGSMATGWIKYKGKDYCLFSSGKMIHDCEMYGYKFDSNGVATKI